MVVCPLKNRCKKYRPEMILCKYLGGMINGNLRTPARCYLNVLTQDLKKQRKMSVKNGRVKKKNNRQL